VLEAQANNIGCWNSCIDR